MVQNAGKAQKTWLGQLGSNIKKFSQWFFIGNAVSTAVRGLRDVVTAVKEIDTAMVELRKITNETAKTYDTFVKNASKSAVELGVALSDYIGSVASFSRMGFDLPDSQRLSELATVYLNVGDGIASMEESTNSIISTMKAFGVSVDDSSRIINVFNEIGNKFAVTSGDAGAAMQDAGAALSTANNSLEKSVAMWTAMNEIMQDGSKSSTALRFIAQRMRNTAGELEELGADADGAAESVTKLQQQVPQVDGRQHHERR